MIEQPNEAVVRAFEGLKALKPNRILDAFDECSICKGNKGVCRGLGDHSEIIGDKIGQGGRLIANTLNKSIELSGIYSFLLFREYWVLPKLGNLEDCIQKEDLEKFVVYRKAIFDALIAKDEFPEDM